MGIKGNKAILLTRSGEFLRVPAGRRAYSPGMEVEVELPDRRKPPFTLPAAGVAAALLIAAALYLLLPTPAGSEAYLAFDLNPGLVFSLDKNAVVIDAAPTNEDGERILELLETEGVFILHVLEALLEESYLTGYLSAGRDNVIVVSLAAPTGFGVSEKDLRDTISKQLLMLEVDTYLKIFVTGMDKASQAKQMKIPLNAFLLGEEMEDMISAEEGHPLLEDSPPVPVQEFLQIVDPDHLFDQDEFIPGESIVEERKPDSSSPQVNIPAERKGEVDGKKPSGNGVESGKPKSDKQPSPP